MRARGRLVLLAAALGCIACEGTGVLVSAERGGVVSSEDGALSIVFPPGALEADTRVAIRVLPESEWPVDAPSRFALIGPVYQVEPAGLELRGDAYAITTPPDVRALRSDTEGELFAVHYLYSPRDERVRPAPATRTLHLADGRVAIVGTLYELGTHWVGDRVPGADRTLPALRARVSALAGEHAAASEWRIDSVSLQSDLPHTLFRRDVMAIVWPHAVPSALRTQGPASAVWELWDGAPHEEFGLHPHQVFGLGPLAADESRSRVSEFEPVLLDGAALDPAFPELPGWRCTATDDAGADLWVEVDVVTGASEGVVTVGVARELGRATCR